MCEELAYAEGGLAANRSRLFLAAEDMEELMELDGGATERSSLLGGHLRSSHGEHLRSSHGGHLRSSRGGHLRSSQSERLRSSHGGNLRSSCGAAPGSASQPELSGGGGPEGKAHADTPSPRFGAGPDSDGAPREQEMLEQFAFFSQSSASSSAGGGVYSGLPGTEAAFQPNPMSRISQRLKDNRGDLVNQNQPSARTEKSAQVYDPFSML